MFWESLRAFNNFAKGSTSTLEASEADNMDVAAMHQLVKDALALASAASGNVAVDLQRCAKTLADHLARYRAPFEWVDGPLVRAMKNGDVLLIDELNLAEDAVLERLNR
jgi:midasin